MFYVFKVSIVSQNLVFCMCGYTPVYDVKMYYFLAAEIEKRKDKTRKPMV